MTLRTVTAGIGLALLAACNQDAGQPAAPLPKAAARAPAAVKPGQSPDELTRGMVEAVTLKNSTVPVGVKFDLPHRPTVGQELDITVAVMPQVAAESAVVRAVGSDQLRVASSVGPIDIAGLDPAAVYRFSIPVTASAEGVQVLQLDVALKHDDVTETRSFSIPLIVAAPGAGPVAAVHPAAARATTAGAPAASAPAVGAPAVGTPPVGAASH